MTTILGLFVALLQALPASGQFVAGDEEGKSWHAGNVGIGTTNPDALLHISSPDTSAVIRLENRDFETGQTGFEVLGEIDFVSQDGNIDGDDPIRAKIVGVAQNESAGAALHFYTANSLNFQSDFRMRLQADGRLALGKGSSAYADGAQLDIQADNGTSSQGGRCAIRLDDGRQAMGKVLTSDDQGRAPGRILLPAAAAVRVRPARSFRPLSSRACARSSRVRSGMWRK